MKYIRSLCIPMLLASFSIPMFGMQEAANQSDHGMRGELISAVEENATSRLDALMQRYAITDLRSIDNTCCLLFAAIKNNNVAMVDHLLYLGIHPDQYINNDQSSSRFTREEMLEVLRTLDAHDPDDHGAITNDMLISMLGVITPLSKAIEQGNTEIVALLLQYGADPNIDRNIFRAPLCNEDISQEDYERLTAYGQYLPHLPAPLFEAVDGRHFEIVRYLIQYGAHVNIACLTPSLHTMDREKENANHFFLNVRSPLIHAMFDSNISIVALLLQHGADPNETSFENPPIEIAISTPNPAKRIKLLELVLQYGATPYIPDELGFPLIHRAPHTETMATLLRYGADPDAQLNVEGVRCTPLHVAINDKDPDRTEMLLQYGARIDAPGCNVDPNSQPDIGGLFPMTDYVFPTFTVDHSVTPLEMARNGDNNNAAAQLLCTWYDMATNRDTTNVADFPSNTGEISAAYIALGQRQYQFAHDILHKYQDARAPVVSFAMELQHRRQEDQELNTFILAYDKDTMCDACDQIHSRILENPLPRIGLPAFTYVIQRYSKYITHTKFDDIPDNQLFINFRTAWHEQKKRKEEIYNSVITRGLNTQRRQIRSLRSLCGIYLRQYEGAYTP